MRKLILAFTLLISVALMSFSSEKEDITNNNPLASIEVENVNGEDGPCRWRYCTYRNGVKIGCTDWEYGYCLDEIVIE